MDEAALYEWLANAEQQNPGALQQMIDAGLFGDRSALSAQQMGQAQGMIDTPSAQGMRVGGTYVASSPLEHAAIAMTRAMGHRQMQDARAQQEGLIGGKGQGMEALIRAMAGPNQRVAPVQLGDLAAPGATFASWE